MPKPLGPVTKPKNFKKSLVRFLAMLKPWRIPIVVALLLAAASTVCGLFGPKILGSMTNTAVEDFGRVIAENGGQIPDAETMASSLNWSKLGSLAWLLILLYVASAILSYIEGVIFSVISANFAKRVRSGILDKITKLPIAYFDRHQIGDTLSRMNNDVEMMANSLASLFTQIVTSITTLVGILIMMFTISPFLSILALIVVPLSLGSISFIAKKAQKFFRAQQATIGALNSIIEEDFSGQTLIKANTHEQASIATFEKTNQKLYQTSWQAQFFATLAFPVTNIFTNFNYVLICIIGGRMTIDGKLLIGSVQAFLQYVNQFNRPITEVSQITANIQQTFAAAERIFEFLDEPEEAPDYEPAHTIDKINGAVEFHHVDFAYTPEKPIIKNYSVKIKPGMQVAIVGPTGAGKTTIINLLMRFYDPDSGYITIDGIPTTEMKRADVRKMFGMVLQDTWLFSGTIEENLRYGRPRATHSEIVAAAKASHVHHFIESLPKGYKTQISEDSDNISAGEKQLLTIVRAMVADPPMMILDEATSNVDTRTEQLIQQAFAKLTHGRTSFVIAHRLSTIRNSDLILVMKDGSIVEHGNHDELLAKNGFYAELYNSQFEENNAPN